MLFMRGSKGGVEGASPLLNSLGKLIQKIGLKNTIIPLPPGHFFSWIRACCYVPICASV